TRRTYILCLTESLSQSELPVLWRTADLFGCRLSAEKALVIAPLWAEPPSVRHPAILARYVPPFC
ncbi:hypothetical protein BDZ89DRAFT_1070769, partial [Hymenopellis radicata]